MLSNTGLDKISMKIKEITFGNQEKETWSLFPSLSYVWFERKPANVNIK